MAMRIWHQSFTVLSDLAAYDDALKAHFRRVARPDTEIVMHGMRPGTYRSNYPGDDIKHVGLQYLHGLQFLAAAVEADREGFDAFALSTLPEPGLREIRAQAQAYLANRNSPVAALSAEMANKDEQIATLQQQMADLMDLIQNPPNLSTRAGIEEANARDAKRRGRPPKAEAEAA
jgi:hypothetical protein